MLGWMLIIVIFLVLFYLLVLIPLGVIIGFIRAVVTARQKPTPVDTRRKTRQTG